MLNPDGTKMSTEEAKEAKRVNAPIVVELFTASDCSACILADRMLYDAMKDKSVIALSCHVNDMTDSITASAHDERDAGDDGNKMNGPMDPCVFRQWTYKSRSSSKDVSITIPQFIINGFTEMGVESLPLFYGAVEGYHFTPRNRTLEVFMQWKDKDTITVNLPQDLKRRADDPISASVWLVRYKDMSVEKINTGVNQGKVLRFSNIVQDIRHVAKWRGDVRSIDVDVEKPLGGKNRGGYAILVQEVMGDEMLAAGKLEDYPMPNDLKRSAEPEISQPQVMEHPAPTATTGNPATPTTTP